MTPLIDKRQVLSDIKKAQQLFDPLRELYKRIPATTCDRQARCCTLIPEVSYIELLHMIRALGRLPQAAAMATLKLEAPGPFNGSEADVNTLLSRL